MTVQPVTIVNSTNAAYPNVLQASWTGLANGDTGAPIAYPQHADKTVHVKGTFGTGGTIVWEGSNDGVTYITLTDAQGNAISKTSEAIEVVEENTLWVRPHVTAGDGTTALSCFVVGTKGTR